MRKRTKLIIRTLLLLLLVIFANGIYYLFWGQFKSTERLKQGKELNLYEMCSVYSMHVGMSIVGWIHSPEATKQVISMTFPWNRGKTIYKETDFFLRYPAISSRYRTQYSRRRIAFHDASYSLSNPDHRLALAVNPGYLWRDDQKVYLEAPIHYPVCYNTHIGITDNFQIVLDECLFNYLEEKHWLHPYTLIYYTSVD